MVSRMGRQNNRVQVGRLLNLAVFVLVLCIFSSQAIARTGDNKRAFPPTFEMVLLHGLHSSGVVTTGDTPLPKRRGLTGTVSKQFKALAAIFYMDFGVPMTVSRNVGRVLRPDMLSFPLSDAASPGGGPLQVLGHHINGALQLRCGNVTVSSVPAQPEHYLGGLHVPTHLVPLPQAVRLSGAADVLVSLLAGSPRPSGVLPQHPSAHLTAMVLLHLVGSHSRGYVSPVLKLLQQQRRAGAPRGARTNAVTAEEVQAFVRDRCSIHVLPPASQAAWPPTLLRATPAHPLAVPPASFGQWRSAGVRRVHAADVSVLDSGGAQGATEPVSSSRLHFYPEVQRDWSPVVPPIPPYCGLRNGSLDTATVRQLQEHHENVFLELKGKFPFADKIMKALCAILMPPVMDPIMDQVMTHVDHTVSDQSGHETVATVPTPVTDRLTKALTYNLTSIMTDSIAAELVDTVPTSITMQMAPRVAGQIQRHLLPRLRHLIESYLHTSLPRKVGAVVPYLLERSLSPILTTQVTRAVTHALVPTLTLALTHSEDQAIWCRACYNGENSADCAKCRYSPVAQFYLNYYSTYYSDYYTEYYQRYYADALRKMDQQQHPKQDQLEAAKLNVGRKAKDRTDDLKDNAYLQGLYDMRRVMTPSGIAVN